MMRLVVLLGLMLMAGAGTVSAQAESDTLPDATRMPPTRALVRYKPRSGATGDWILGSMAVVRMTGGTCIGVFTEVPDDPIFIVGKRDSLEVASQEGSVMLPRGRAQIDSMAAGATWQRVDLAQALEGIPDCLPGYR